MHRSMKLILISKRIDGYLIKWVLNQLLATYLLCGNIIMLTFLDYYET